MNLRIVRTSTTDAFTVTPPYGMGSGGYTYNRILRNSSTGLPSNHLVEISGTTLRSSNLSWDADRLASRGETDMNWNYSYDRKGQVAQAFKRFTASNSNVVVAGTQSQYDYDGIGNRTTLNEGGNGTTSSTAQPNWTEGLRQTKYFANERNEYTGIERPETFDVTGRRSNTNAAITVNGSGASYQGLYFRKEVANTPTPFSAGDVYEPVQVKEGTNILTPDPDPVQYLGVPWRNQPNFPIPNPISFDPDGNLLTDGRWTYTWDGENRLISMSAPAWTQPAGPIIPGGTLDAITLSFRYDGLSRRISKKVTITTNGVAESTMEGYLYDGWNPVMITKLDPAATSETVLTRKWSCLWRPDVGSSLYARSSWQKAGGVGGLAWLQTGSAQNLSTGGTSGAIVTGSGEVHIPMADHMGNIRHYVHFRPTTATGPYGSYTNLIVSQSANFEYDAFGREVRANGTTVVANPPPPATPITPPGLTAGTAYADALPFHFSSKFTDPESGLNYYGYRFYDPKDGRWLSRDPAGERGGENFYQAMKNNILDYIDVIGAYPWRPGWTGRKLGINTPVDVGAALRHVRDGHQGGVYWDPKPICPKGCLQRFIQVVKQDVFGTSHEWVDTPANPAKKGLAGLFYGDADSADYPLPGIDAFADAPTGQAYDAIFEVCRLCVCPGDCGGLSTGIGPCVTWKRHHGTAGIRTLDTSHPNDGIDGPPSYSPYPSQQWMRTVGWTLSH